MTPREPTGLSEREVAVLRVLGRGDGTDATSGGAGFGSVLDGLGERGLAERVAPGWWRITAAGREAPRGGEDRG